MLDSTRRDLVITVGAGAVAARFLGSGTDFFFAVGSGTMFDSSSSLPFLQRLGLIPSELGVFPAMDSRMFPMHQYPLRGVALHSSVFISGEGDPAPDRAETDEWPRDLSING